MPDTEQAADIDFDSELRGLFEEAQQDLESRAAASRRSEESTAQVVLPLPVAGEISAAEAESTLEATREAVRQATNLPQPLRPVVLGIEALTRAVGDNSTILGRIDRSQHSLAESQSGLPQIVSELRGLIDQKTGLNQRMFDALHEELRGYKDGFLLDSVHRPIIRDMISLYDDVVEIQRQARGIADGFSENTESLTRMGVLDTNLAHHATYILEVLARLEVTPMPIGTGKLDKRLQRAVAVEPAEDPADDTLIVRSAKRGFFWKHRVVRAEEVVIKKYKEGSLVALVPEPKLD